MKDVTITDYKKYAFQLDELIRHLLIDTETKTIDDFEELFNKYYTYWQKIKKENKNVYDDLYCISDEELKELDNNIKGDVNEN